MKYFAPFGLAALLVALAYFSLTGECDHGADVHDHPVATSGSESERSIPAVRVNKAPS